MAISAYDQFEIMFNRPAGKYRNDIPPSGVFGTIPATTYGDGSDVFFPNAGEDQILEVQWEAMIGVWDDFNLSDHNDEDDVDENFRTKRRGWFYTGGGMCINNDGTINEHGQMGERVVAPATPKVYIDEVLSKWSEKDDRFRCFFLDAMVNCFGKQVELVHELDVFEEYTLVGEAVPQGNTEFYTQQARSRRSAPWFAMVGVPRGPWWNEGLNHNTSFQEGYNANWTTDWREQTMYFGVQANSYPNLHEFDGPVGAGDNLSLGDAYLWVLKGASPVAWYTDSYRKIGAAWNYATGRLLPSRVTVNPRLLRGLRV